MYILILVYHNFETNKVAQWVFLMKFILTSYWVQFRVKPFYKIFQKLPQGCLEFLKQSVEP